MQRSGLAQHNIAGTYPDLRQARRAIDALEFAGVDAGHISLSGAIVATASHDADDATNTTPRDLPMLGHVLKRAVIGALVGGVLLAIFGALLWSVGAYGDLSAAATVLLLAVLGAIIGALVGGCSAISQGDGWELTFQPEPDDAGDVIVGVHSDNVADIRRAMKVLRDKQAADVSEFDANGTPERI